ncbi:MAG: glycosyltransferase [Microgenomates group bacterium]|jgi:glycosyltransferase involved in cell wall biosynthesis
MDKNLKVALVHDYLREYGGAERVLEALHEMFPEAPIYTSYLNLNGLGPHAQRIKNWNIKTSWMQNLPFANKLISPLRVLAPAAFESFDLTEYDLVISSSSSYFANTVITSPEALHINYIHTPPRYLYGYATSYNYKKHWWTRIAGEIANHFLRLMDFEIAQRPDVLIANSKNIAARIKKFYRRDSEVIYPPIDVKRFKNIDLRFKKEREYYLSLGRLVRGKGTEIIVEACTKLDLPLKVVGSGPELERLKKLAGKNVEFLGLIKDEDIPEILAGAKATIVASEDEDFGIVPVESMAAGTPVIALRAGGFLETVVEGNPSTSSGRATGEFFEKATTESLMEVLKEFKPEKYESENCVTQAEKFSKEEFKKKISQLIEKNYRVDWVKIFCHI